MRVAIALAMLVLFTLQGNAQARTVYVANNSTASVSAYELTTSTLVATIGVGTGPIALGLPMALASIPP